MLGREIDLCGEEVGPQVVEAPGSLQAVLGKWFLASRVKAEPTGVLELTWL